MVGHGFMCFCQKGELAQKRGDGFRSRGVHTPPRRVGRGGWGVLKANRWHGGFPRSVRRGQAPRRRWARVGRAASSTFTKAPARDGRGWGRGWG